MVWNTAICQASLLLQIAIAMPWMGPVPTPIGLMAIAGVSPRPTEAPGSNGIPQELRKREIVQYPPPANWCGFINSVYDSPLSCSKGLTCVNSGEAFGCCTATTGLCSALYTGCVDYNVECDQLCQQAPAIRKCGYIEAFCVTYAFNLDTTLFDCAIESVPIQDVGFLNDFYITAIGSTLAPDATRNPFGFTANVSLNPFFDSPTNTATGSDSVTSSSSRSSSALYWASSSASYSGSSSGANSGSSSGANSGSSSSTTYHPPPSGLSQGAIDGIAAGAGIIGVSVLCLVVFCCVRARRRKGIAAASRPPTYLPSSMQQQTQPTPPKAFDGYQSVPQQEQQYTQYPGPHQEAQPCFSPPPSAISPQSSSANPPHYSTANTSLLSPPSSEPEQRQSSYKPPLSPTVTEVDGTMGNPGVPNDIRHGVPTEVDGTMGNPGVPDGGHGIEYQMMPGGSPSAAEIDSKFSHGVQQAPLQKPMASGQQGIIGASMSQPYSEEPYELGPDRR